MFKYKSPLSRLLEGAGKPKEPETEEVTEVSADKPEPIADFNALRVALAGNNMPSSGSYEDTEDLLPEEDMPEFAENEPVADTSDDKILSEVVAEAHEPADEIEPEQVEEDPIVTLHVATEETIAETEVVLVDATTSEPVIEVVAEEPSAQIEEVTAEVVDGPLAPQSEETTAEVVETPPAPQAVQSDRRGRVKTTFLGFERADTHVQDLMETSEPVAKTESAQQTFPVGWLVVTAGPGRGACITLTEGLMQIGRNDDQAIQLDFGDTGISRSNHAVIAYDPEDRKCYLGHGGKANLVRLNGKPVLSTVALNSGDLIRISETSVRFAAFCDDGFDWRDA
ncbi:FHA domain-containing protein [Ruegeria lacuscaerulensis]|uniref:FHA domain-containing protein n=1 Tax=Ruegeria lacuscaerulensis TaxID=55218 RepID=UPI00147FB6F6|nr:FHA domain-containing protein [Ruegeria lacuscaerulensis]